MSVPGRPNPPVVGKVTHNTVELYWEPPEKASPTKNDDRLQYSVEEGERTKGFGNVYSGFSTSHVFEGLEPSTEYRYRVRCKNHTGNSAWSAVITVKTTKKPKTNEDLHKAVAKRDLEMVNKVLEAQKGYLEIVKALVNQNADVQFQNSSGKTALIMACFAGQLEVAKVLRARGAGWETVDHTGSTALHWAADGGNLDVIRWMFSEGCKVDVKDKTSGWTPLMRVAAVTGNANVAKLLIHHGANVNSRDKDGKTVLMNAAMNGYDPLVKVLVKRGATIQTKNAHGKTALDFARTFEHERIISYLHENLECLRHADKQRRIEEARGEGAKAVDKAKGEEKENVKSEVNGEAYLKRRGVKQ